MPTYGEPKDSNQESFFFRRHAGKEIRLGVCLLSPYLSNFILVLLRFGRKCSSFGPSHSSSVMLFCKYTKFDNSSSVSEPVMRRATLTRYSGMTLGPKERNTQQLQKYLKIIVDDLLMLYRDSSLIQCPEYLTGAEPNSLSSLHASPVLQVYLFVLHWLASLRTILPCTNYVVLLTTACHSSILIQM
jgi:hypothetical protein